MSADLQARKEAKDLIITTVPGVPVLWAGADQPTTGEYIIISVIPGANVNTRRAYSFSRVRLQADVWHLSVSDSTAATHGAQLVLAFSDAGWTVPSGNVYPPEGQKDAQGRKWQRYSLDLIKQFSHN